jgi:hypothetical protein
MKESVGGKVHASAEEINVKKFVENKFVFKSQSPLLPNDNANINSRNCL